MSRTTLKPIVSKLRESIIKGIAGKLEKYGFDNEGNLKVEKPLSNYDREIRDNVLALFEAKKILNQEKYTEYIHNTSRTFMHVLICYSLMEKRGIMSSLLENVINTSIYNEILPDFIRVNPLAFDEFGRIFEKEIEELANYDNEEEDREYYHFLQLMKCLTKEMSKEVPLIFRDYEFNLIHPDYDDMKVILSLISSIEKSEFEEDDFLGWIYQYWVDTTKDEVRRAEEEENLSYSNEIYFKIIKGLSDEQSEYGEFYTPRNVVKSIVDESIDAYLESSQKELKEIKVLDPACGAGNFLVYAFSHLMDLFEQKYPMQSIQDRITNILSNNIYGADIQKEPLQITAINLWIKAKTIAEDAKIKNLNLINVNILRADSLYPWETEEEFHQMSLFEEYEEPQYTYENIGNLITRNEMLNHNNAVSFFSNKFGVIIMNPPYLGIRKMKPEVADFLKTYYPKNYFNLFEAFIVRAYELLENKGICGFVGTDTFMTLDSYENLRILMLQKTRINRIKQIGNVFDGPTVNAVIMIFEKNKDNKNHKVICKSETSQFKYESAILQQQFKIIKGYPIIPTLTNHIADIFKKSKTLVEYADIKQGMISGNNKRYLRYRWEIPKDLIGKRFFPYANGGGYSKYANDIVEYIDYEDDGRILKEDAKQKYGSASRTIKNVNYFFRPGITYSPIGGNTFSARKLPKDCIFSDKGPCIFSSQINEIYLLGYANSKIFNYFIKLLNPTIGFAIADIERVPFKEPKKDLNNSVIQMVSRIVDIKEFIIGFDKKSDFFHETEIQYGIDQGATTIEEAYNLYSQKYMELCDETDRLQEELDNIFYDIYNISEEEKSIIEENITGRIISQEDVASIEKTCLSYLRYQAYCVMSKETRLYTVEDLVKEIEHIIEEQFDNGYQIIEEIEDILGKKIKEVISSGVKVDGINEKFAGTSTSDLYEPLILANKLAGTGKNTISVFWATQSFLIEYEENKKYSLQNEIRRMTDEIFMPKLLKTKNILQNDSLSKSDISKLEKEVKLYEDCVKTLENWKVVD